jgi:PAS domain S-box-containing protein
MRQFSAVLDSGENSRPTQMAEALRNLQRAVAQCHDAVFITDASGVVTRVNGAFEQLTSRPALELVGKDLSLITEGGAQSPEYQRIWREIFEEKQYAGTLNLRNKSGTVTAVEVVITPVRGSRGRVVSLVGTCHVVAQPEAPEPVPPSESSLDPNVARMIHDLRNMLLVILAHADLACESLAREHPSRRHVENVKSAAQGAAALVHEFTQNEAYPLGNDSQLRVNARSSRSHTSHLLKPSEHEPHQVAANPATVLLVEDESLIRESSVEFLLGTGFNVISAASAEEALQEVQRHQGSIDLLITDVALPKMTGPELAATLTSTHPETKVLLISGHSELEMPAQSSTTPQRFLAKPFSLFALHDTIRELLQQKKQPRSAGVGV